MAKRHLRKTGSQEPQPESRMLFLQLGMALVPVGLIMFAWSAEKQLHWAVPLAGAAIFSLGMLMAYVCIQTYLVDVYENFAASALAATVAVRSIAACIFSIMGFQLYASLGYGWYVLYSFHTIHHLADIDIFHVQQGNHAHRLRMHCHAANTASAIQVRPSVAQGCWDIGSPKLKMPYHKSASALSVPLRPSYLPYNF